MVNTDAIPTVVPDRDNTPAYFARCLCGCKRVVFASVDDGAHPKETAKSIASMIRKGYHIERGTVAEIRKAEWMCKQKDGAQSALL